MIKMTDYAAESMHFALTSMRENQEMKMLGNLMTSYVQNDSLKIDTKKCRQKNIHWS